METKPIRVLVTKRNQYGTRCYQTDSIDDAKQRAAQYAAIPGTWSCIISKLTKCGNRPDEWREILYVPGTPIENQRRCKNLRTGQEAHYVGPDARTAVICAYAQESGDFNTWDYEIRYGPFVMTGAHGYYLGDWGCLFDGR